MAFDPRNQITRFNAGQSSPGQQLSAFAGNDAIEQQGFLSRAFSNLFNPDLRGQRAEVEEAGRAAGRSADVDRKTLEMQTRSLDLSDRQKAGLGKKLGLGRAVAIEDARAAKQRGFSDRRKAVRGLAGAFSNELFGQELGVKADTAAIDAAKKSAEANRKEAKSSAKKSLFGNIAGIALAAVLSSEKAKDDHGKAGSLLSKLEKVRVNRWNYKGDDDTHIGPFAEEFNREFKLDTKRPHMISIVDALGVTLGSVKELNEKVERLGG
jgi:hypothetical protein